MVYCGVVMRRRKPDPNLVILAAVVLALGAAEAVLHVTRPDLRDPTYFQSIGNPLKQYDEDRELFWTRSFAGRPDLIRNAKERNLLYVFGGSIAVGLADPLFAVLKEGGVDVGGFNLACGGWTSHQSVIQLRRFLAVRAPTHALIANGYNDSRPAVRDYAAQARLNRSWTRRVLFELNRSRLFTLYRRLLLRAGSASGPAPDTVCVPLDRYRANLAEFVRLVRDAGATPILVTQAFPDADARRATAPYFGAMEDVARAGGAVFVDVRPAIAEASARLGVPDVTADEPGFLAKKGLLWSDAVHPSEGGYRIESEVIRRTVAEKGGWR
jgi:lysophospholipase L1-like esterase